ncbi:MAG: GNAT family N-acetyltransferase [Sphaerochaeta sp.]|nr:GNAT family N-acetyltransferase [Sphaerochaeta sp.]
MITIQPAEIKDSEILWTLQKEAFLPLWERYHDAGDPYLREPQDILRKLSSPQYHCFCILDDAQIIGGILYATMANEIEREYYLHRLFIAPERQNQGIGRKAIALCERELADATLFSVEFPQDLEKNRTCYTKAGFKDTGRRVKTEEGIVLARFEKRIIHPCSGT